MYSTPSYYNYTYSSPYSTASTAAGVGFITGLFIVFLVLIVLACVIHVVIAEWKIFKKAGQEGWKSLIPIYNIYTMLKILNMEPLLCLLFFVPGATFLLKIVMNVKLAQSFKKGVGFAVGLILLQPIFELILGFGSAKYTQLPSSK